MKTTKHGRSWIIMVGFHADYIEHISLITLTNSSLLIVTCIMSSVKMKILLLLFLLMRCFPGNGGELLDSLLSCQCRFNSKMCVPQQDIGRLTGNTAGNKHINNSPLLMTTLMNTTSQKCQQEFHPNKLFGHLRMDHRKVHFIDNKGHFLAVDTFPFISSGSFGVIADVVLGTNNGILEEHVDLNPFATREKLVIQIRGDNAWDQLKLLKSHLSKLKKAKKIILIIGHSDLGFPSGREASSRAHLDEGVNQNVPIFEEFLKQTNGIGQNIQWSIYASNYDDASGRTAAIVKPIPLGLSTAAWIKDQLPSLCNIVGTSVVLKQPNEFHIPPKWVFVSFKEENNPTERSTAMAAAKRLAQTSKYTDGVGFIRDNFERTSRIMLDYRFVITPAGRGLDSHRILEALMLGRIPIVIWSPHICAYDGLPILRLSSWDELSWPLLEETWTKFMQYSAKDIQTMVNHKRLFMPYWKSLIESDLVT